MQQTELGSTEQRIVPPSPDAYPDLKTQPVFATLEKLSTSDDPNFDFLRQFVDSRDPLHDQLYGQDKLASLQYTVRDALVPVPETQLFAPVKLETWGSEVRFGEKPTKLNADATIALPFGRGRILLAALDGASSQAPIDGLQRYGIGGDWMVSHLASIGFPQSQEFAELSVRPNVTAKDVLMTMNKYLREKLGAIDGVDYGNKLKIPGMAGTIALVDHNQHGITIAHAADTVAIAEYEEGYRVLTDNKNGVFDAETAELIESIVRETGLSYREAAQDPRVKTQLKESFDKKINAAEVKIKVGGKELIVPGVGIINGEEDLFTNGLVTTSDLEIDDKIRRLYLATDGLHGAWLGRTDIDDETRYRALLGMVSQPYNTPRSPIYQASQRMMLDSRHTAIPRIKPMDDAALVQTSYRGSEVPSDWAMENSRIALQELADFIQVVGRTS